MTQKEALSILKTGASVFLTGEPGAGKTHTINEYVKYLKDHDIEPAITASTGIAATHIGGMTIHSWSGLGIKTFLTKYDLDKIASTEYLFKRIKKTRVLIIDEVSMLHPNMLSMIDAVCREVTQNPEPFGALQVILVGDFFQLPPISSSRESREENLFGNEEKQDFAYESSAWNRLSPIVCYLTEQHRQEDDEFLSVLSAIRSDSVDELHVEFLNKRRITPEKAPQNITKLFSHNRNVDDVNHAALGKIKKPEKSFKMFSKGSDTLIAALTRGCLSPETLCLREGASVMFTKNNSKDGFANGTLGTVTGFSVGSNYPIVETKQGKKITVEPMDWVVEEGGKIKASISQIPLRLAWAITVHKSQGMSLDAAVVDLSHVFEFGQGYVALSRVRSLSGLYLLGMNRQALQVHPKILEQDSDMRQSSEQARDAFASMSKAELEKMHDNFLMACAGKKAPVKKKASKAK